MSPSHDALLETVVDLVVCIDMLNQLSITLVEGAVASVIHKLEECT